MPRHSSWESVMCFCAPLYFFTITSYFITYGCAVGALSCERLTGQDGAVGGDFGGKIDWPIQKVIKIAKAGMEL